MRWPGTNSVTFTGNARPGAAFDLTVTVAPGAIVPSTASTPESQRA
jgi:hypothetical protein